MDMKKITVASIVVVAFVSLVMAAKDMPKDAHAPKSAHAPNAAHAPKGSTFVPASAPRDSSHTPAPAPSSATSTSRSIIESFAGAALMSFFAYYVQN
ncbi:uncharacterized protein LOC133719685 [Rosa rugosa]|uniref:uncharacterized protein LOC133719685 n=1 Tax=Rosa rugosa TaxID=74645 RepID=UPI002B409BAC|nr:uncharacterized protein LOC133719685 [Rosa rugosa]